ncbi:MAG: zinc-ribbon domain-containing protein, partial [Clostridiales bacterium]|nr:zinc-ribbon domain-containing protein [Clostridiales bacterium]
ETPPAQPAFQTPEDKPVFCGQCGARNERGIKFCGSCGAKI